MKSQAEELGYQEYIDWIKGEAANRKAVEDKIKNVIIKMQDFRLPEILRFSIIQYDCLK
ncbi:MAG: hypothetical protein K6C35_04625 [Eubacterium sp.]|nr:hypothetical protein [Eubacterium sp.]